MMAEAAAGRSRSKAELNMLKEELEDVKQEEESLEIAEELRARKAHIAELKARSSAVSCVPSPPDSLSDVTSDDDGLDINRADSNMDRVSSDGDENHDHDKCKFTSLKIKNFLEYSSFFPWKSCVSSQFALF